jgi:hypothetical protein
MPFAIDPHPSAAPQGLVLAGAPRRVDARESHGTIVLLVASFNVPVARLARSLPRWCTMIEPLHLFCLMNEKPLITRLPRNGPKPGQSMAAWLHGKDKHCQAERDAVQWKKP